jgi:hypothetical protein
MSATPIPFFSATEFVTPPHGESQTSMGSASDAKRRRDSALDLWRTEVRRLFDLEKSQRERARQAEAELQKQRAIVSEARDRYERANDEYMHRIHRRSIAPERKQYPASRA